MVNGKLRGHCLDTDEHQQRGRLNPYEWRSAEWPDLVGVSVTAMRRPGAEVRVSNGITFMGILLTGEQAAEMGAVLIEFSRTSPDSRREADQ
jgi:hypothetical protein